MCNLVFTIVGVAVIVAIFYLYVTSILRSFKFPRLKRGKTYSIMMYNAIDGELVFDTDELKIKRYDEEIGLWNYVTSKEIINAERNNKIFVKGSRLFIDTKGKCYKRLYRFLFNIIDKEDSENRIESIGTVYKLSNPEKIIVHDGKTKGGIMIE